MNFTAPIPGQSLTIEPGNAPWEQPPQIEDPEEAIKYQTKRLTKPDVMDDMLFALESGFPVKAMVETLNTVATMNGVYSVDVGLLVAPVLHEFIITAAKKAKVQYEEGFGNKAKDAEKEKAKVSYMISKRLESLKAGDEGAGLLTEMTDSLTEATPDATMQDEATAAPIEAAPVAKTGLMARKGTM